MWLKELALEEKKIQGEFELRKAALEQEERNEARKVEEREREHGRPKKGSEHV